MAKSYKERKAEIRQAAIEFQHEVIENELAWWDIAHIQERFEKMGKRYGLIHEFRENGII